MKKLSAKQKKWNIAKSQKVMRKLSKRKARKQKKNIKQNNKSFILLKTHNLYAPTNLSLNNNEEETIAFFKNALDIGQQCSFNHRIYINLQNVEHITADAVMYIIAFMSNFKRLKILRVRIEGNLPKVKSARTFLEDIGFYSYVSGLKRTHESNIKDKIQISHGQNVDGTLVGKICDFINNIMRKADFLSTKRLYSMIMELMTNTRQHAYNKDKKSSIMECNWYVFAQKLNNHIEFIFLDTGVGIPATLRYNYVEKVKKLFLKNDASFISSALKGEFRTETKQINRGKGLPGIYKDSVNGRIKNMSIISGRGKCCIKDNGEIEENNLSSHFEGTLFCWNYITE